VWRTKGVCRVWKTRSLENAGCGKCGVWIAQGLVENTGSAGNHGALSGKHGAPSGKHGTLSGQHGAPSGKHGVWKTWVVENTGCGKHEVCEKKNSVCKKISFLSVALDEIPTATFEPFEIAT